MNLLLNHKRTWPIGHFLHTAYGSLELAIMDRYNPGEHFEFLKALWKEDGRLKFMFRPSEILTLCAMAQSYLHLEGVFVEVGVFPGTSAKGLAEVIRNSGNTK